jgi:hypothetical protein
MARMEATIKLICRRQHFGYTKTLHASHFGRFLLENSPTSNGLEAFNQMLSDYKNRARIRGLQFLLTESEFYDLAQGCCFYCGEAPEAYGEGVYSQFFVRNGIDRQDNDLGYTAENCVSCCTFCNKAKSNHSVGNFLEKIKNIFYNIPQDML